MHPKLPSRGGICEGFAVELTDSDSVDAVGQCINEVMGPEWTMQSFGGRDTGFQLRKLKGKLSARGAWEKCYALRALSGVAYAEPLFATVADNPAWTTDPNASNGDEPHLPESLHPEWSFEAIHAREAWAKFFPNASRRPGYGVVIGHPDTGYSDHPELEGRIISTKGYDFLYDDPDAHDDLERPLVTPVPNPGHGTGTASAIVSPQGSAGKYPGGGWVTGVAPGAEIIPLRTAYSVLLWSTLNLARAIEYATNEGAHVISISMGGLWSWRLRRAVVFAQSRGVIICAAAGNYAPFVGWPGAYDEVIACAASNARGGTWRWSCRGQAVDVTAPGESVWRATVSKNGNTISYDVSRTSGTSFATTITAGVAAMWLSHHGRDSLIARYGRENLPFVFQRVLRESCVNFPGWKEGKFGAGLIDALRTLEAPLPDVDATGSSGMRTRNETHPEIDRGGLATFAHLFGLNRMKLVRPLAELLRVNEEEVEPLLGAIGQELAFHIATDPMLYREFRSNLENENAMNLESLREGVASRASSLLGSRITDQPSAKAKIEIKRSSAPQL
ncbi:MAG: S8 family serine peptidase [Gemmatimonadaceae bacterium]